MSCLLMCLVMSVFDKEYKSFSMLDYKPQVIQEQYDKEEDYLIKALYWEALSEGDRGKALIAQVIINRTKHKDFPNTISGVISEKWQFTFYSDRKIKQKIPTWWYRHIKKIAQKARQGHYEGMTKSLWYKRCDWYDSFFETRKFEQFYGDHCFYI